MCNSINIHTCIHTYLHTTYIYINIHIYIYTFRQKSVVEARQKTRGVRLKEQKGCCRKDIDTAGTN